VRAAIDALKSVRIFPGFNRLPFRLSLKTTVPKENGRGFTPAV